MQLLKNKKVELNNKVITRNIVCIVLAVLTVFFTIIAFNFFFKITPEEEYKEALKLIDQGKIGDAVEILYSLDGYKDSRQLFEKMCCENSSLFLYLLKTGDTFDFGTYQGEKINWTVIDEKDGMLLVESTYVVDAMEYSVGKYDHGYNYLFWENTIVNNWANGEFLNDFSECEIKAIYEKDLGKVFILSKKESEKYNAYEEAKGTNLCNEKLQPQKDENTEYWLRYEKSDYEHIYYMHYEYQYATGSYSENTYKEVFAWNAEKAWSGFSNEICGVRPCMWIKPCEIID